MRTDTLGFPRPVFAPNLESLALCGDLALDSNTDVHPPPMDSAIEEALVLMARSRWYANEDEDAKAKANSLPSSVQTLQYLKFKAHGASMSDDTVQKLLDLEEEGLGMDVLLRW